MNIYDFQVKDAKGNVVNLSEYKGKTLLVVNTATGCGFTPQYKGLQHLYEKYQSKGLEILDFPCNQFGKQAPGTEEDIHQFCEINYKTTFRLFSKIDVNGKNELPLYTYLKGQKGGFLNKRIKWNFTKFLINKKGEVIERFGPMETPEAIEEKIARIL
ncbi:MAG TPA: glutathione peroxidase [Paludibacteraceae bacterium]|nr:glutathione peroxidase [Paludibacteraceae bacterium]